jgi:RNA polymerase sigma-70 factor, ECF subfamily
MFVAITQPGAAVAVPGHSRSQRGRDPKILASRAANHPRWHRRRPAEPGRDLRGRILDRELVERAQHGDESAFAALAVRISDRLYAVAHHILRDTERADDAAQQAMIDIWRHLPELQDPDRFQAWSYRIVVRAAYAEAKRHRLWNLAPAMQREPLVSPDHAPAVADREQLDRGLGRLAVDHRAVVVLKHFANLSNAEIAEALDVPEGTVRSRLFHAIRALRAELDADARGVPGMVEP